MQRVIHKYKGNYRQRISSVIHALASIADALILLCSLTTLSSHLSAKYLFSDFAEKIEGRE